MTHRPDKATSDSSQLSQKQIRDGTHRSGGVTTELDLYLQEKVWIKETEIDLLAWWKTNGVKYPRLQKIARDILAIPISTVASESAFSTSGRLPHVDMFAFHGSCNGLVLVSGHDVDGGHRLVVLNLTTKVFLEIPESGFDIVDELREIDIVYGFGYDSVSDDYKVVTVSFYNNEEEVNDIENIFVHVYSLKTDTWRQACRFPYDHSYGKSYPGVFVNGYLHWIAIKDSDEDLRVIVAFSLADERLSEVALPKSCNDEDVGVKNGLELAFGEKLEVFMEGDVWLMMEYGVVESWTKVVLGGIAAGLMVRLKVFYENGKLLVVAGDVMLVWDIEEGRLCDHLDTNKVKNELKLAFGEKVVVFMEGDVWLMMEYGVVESWPKVVLGGIDAGLMVRLKVFYENGKLLVVAGDVMLVWDIEEGRLCDRLDTNKFDVKGICVESLVSPKFNRRVK
ncbi:F-box protein At3g07870-like [Bidens hawaiensis]|uniref:F-box protein At3g07870-like n=1 Tax=Bidens hawaiensis TaxID=980011 RepID=UPI00404B8E60